MIKLLLQQSAINDPRFYFRFYFASSLKQVVDAKWAARLPWLNQDWIEQVAAAEVVVDKRGS